MIIYNFGFILILSDITAQMEMTANNISDGLTTKKFGAKLFVFDTIDSTNTCARLLAECGSEEGTVVYAEEQSSGRGRLKRKWISEKGANLLFSIVFAPNIKERRYYLLPLLVSVCVVDGIKKEAPECPVIVKWPNDILLTGGEKIGGILTELTHTYEDKLRIIVGVGLNVNQKKFPSELQSIASSLYIATGKEIDRVRLLHSILTEIESQYESVTESPETIVDRWKSHCTMFEKPVRVTQGAKIKTGICKDIDRDGALLIEDNKGKTYRILAGDITSVAINT